MSGTTRDCSPPSVLRLLKREDEDAHDDSEDSIRIDNAGRSSDAADDGPTGRGPGGGPGRSRGAGPRDSGVPTAVLGTSGARR